MAAASGRNSSGKKKLPAKSSSRISGSVRKSTASTRKKIDYEQAAKDSALFHEISLIILFVAVVFLFFCNFGLVGAVGNAISGVMFGLFGFTAYVTPILLFLAMAFWYANQGSPTAVRKMMAAFVLFLMVGILCELFTDNVKVMEKYSLARIYQYCSSARKGGGIFAGSLAYLLHHNLETIGTVLVVVLLSIISIILLTERSFLDTMKNGGERLRERTLGDAEYRKEIAEKRREEQESLRESREEERRLRDQEREEERRRRAEEKENEKILRMDKKVTGVSKDTALKTARDGYELRETKKHDVHEIIYTEEPETGGIGAKAEEMKARQGAESPRQALEDMPEPIISGKRVSPSEAAQNTAKVSAVAAGAGARTAAAAVAAVDDEVLAARERMQNQFQRDQIARNAEQGRERFQRDGEAPLPREAEKIQVHSGGQGDGMALRDIKIPFPSERPPRSGMPARETQA